jgi:hypothetical protein
MGSKQADTWWEWENSVMVSRVHLSLFAPMIRCDTMSQSRGDVYINEEISQQRAVYSPKKIVYSRYGGKYSTNVVYRKNTIRIQW